MEGWVVILGLIGLAVFGLLKSCVIVVRHSEAVVLERFSKFHRILESGINFILPCMVRQARAASAHPPAPCPCAVAQHRHLPARGSCPS
jgi:regulator of protease activity HflC (stomatin/prohibitin superfamily)